MEKRAKEAGIVIMRDHDNNGATPNVQVIDKFFSKPGSYKIVYNIFRDSTLEVLYTCRQL